MPAIRGFGAYKIGNNSVLAGGMSPPMIVNSVRSGGMIVRHREYLRDITASNLFKGTTFTINPGLPETFPWLAQIAGSFEQYRMRGLLFEYKTTSSDTILSSATSTALGTVVMGTQYNVLDEPFDNKFEMENYEFSNSSKPSLSMIHPIECAKSQTPISLLYVRTPSTDTSKGDPRLYDLAKFTIATVGMQGQFNTPQQNNAAIGELWCTYEVEFFKPVMNEDSSTQSALFDWDYRPEDELPVLGLPVSGKPWGNLGTVENGQTWKPPKHTRSTIDARLNPGIFDSVLNPNGNPLPGGQLEIYDCISKRLQITFTCNWDETIVNDYVRPVLFSQPTLGYRIVPAWSNNANQFSILQSTFNAQFAVVTFLVDIISDVAYIRYNSNAFNYTTQGGAANPVVFANLLITEVNPALTD